MKIVIDIRNDLVEKLEETRPLNERFDFKLVQCSDKIAVYDDEGKEIKTYKDRF